MIYLLFVFYCIITVYCIVGIGLFFYETEGSRTPSELIEDIKFNLVTFAIFLPVWLVMVIIVCTVLFCYNIPCYLFEANERAYNKFIKKH